MNDAWNSAWVEVLPDFSQFKRKADSEITSVLGSAGAMGAGAFGTSFRSGVGQVFTGSLLADAALGAARAAGDLIGSAIRGAVEYSLGAIDLASSLAEQANAVQVAYGTAGGAVQKMVQDTAASLNLTRLDFSNYAVRFSAFTRQIAGDGGDIAGTLRDLTTRGADFASVYDIEVANALELFQSGLAGETEPLRKFGIDLSAAAVSAYAYANGIGTVGKELTEGEKIQARYGLLMESTSNTAGDLTNTFGSLANQQRALTVGLSEAQTQLGEYLLPGFLSLVTAANEKVIPAIGGIIEKVGPVLGTALENVGPQFDALVEKVTPLIEQFTTAAAEDGIPAFIGVMDEVASAAPEWIEGYNSIDRSVRELDAGYTGFMLDVQKFTEPARKQMVSWVEDYQKAWESAFGSTKTNSDEIKSYWKSHLDQMRADTAAAAAGGTLLGGQFAQGFADGITTYTEAVALAAERMALRARDKVINTMQIASPSKVMRELGGRVSEGYALGITDNMSMVDSAFAPLLSSSTYAAIGMAGTATQAPMSVTSELSDASIERLAQAMYSDRHVDRFAQAISSAVRRDNRME